MDGVSGVLKNNVNVNLKKSVRLIDSLRKSFKSLKWYEWVMAIIMIAIAGWTMVSSFMNPGKSALPSWLTVVNFISAICGVICIFFCAKASISNYAFGIVNTIVYVVYLAYRGTYGTLGLEIFVYLPVNIAGWVLWVKHRDKVYTEKTKAKKANTKQNIISTIGVLAISFGCYFLLNKFDGTTAILDAFTVGLGIVATVLQFLRYREQYVWWLVQDVIAVAMYIVDFDPVYLTKKSIYLIMAVIGLYNWVKLQKERNLENE